MEKGNIRIGFREYFVFCSGCGEQEVDFLSRVSHFIGDLRKNGWKLKKGLWYCNNCCKLIKLK